MVRVGFGWHDWIMMNVIVPYSVIPLESSRVVNGMTEHWLGSRVSVTCEVACICGFHFLPLYPIPNRKP